MVDSGKDNSLPFEDVQVVDGVNEAGAVGEIVPVRGETPTVTRYHEPDVVGRTQWDILHRYVSEPKHLYLLIFLVIVLALGSTGHLFTIKEFIVAHLFLLEGWILVYCIQNSEKVMGFFKRLSRNKKISREQQN